MDNEDEKTNCKYCKSSIDPKAKVCHYCGKYQKKILNNILSINAIATLISLMLLLLAFLQYHDSNIEKQSALDASNNAKIALEKVKQTEQRVLLIRNDIVKTSRAFVEIAEILPRSTGYGAGLSDSDHKKLQRYSDSLNVLIKSMNSN